MPAPETVETLDVAAALAPTTPPASAPATVERELAPLSPKARAAILFAVALAYLPVVTFGFVRWDDPYHVLENPLLRDPSAAPLIDHLRTPMLGYAVPVTMLSYRLEYALVGTRVPALYHLTNLVLHLVSVALLMRLARKFGAGPRATAVAALTFGLHPAVAEPVAWVSGRKDVLALAFALGALDLALGNRTARRSVAAFVLFVLSLLSKPVTVWLVPMMAGCWWRSARGSGVAPRAALRDTARRIAPYAVVAAIDVAVSAIGQVAVGSVRAPPTLAVQAREMWFALGMHVRIAFLAEEPTAKYMPPVWPAPFTPAVDLAPVVLVLGASTLIVLLGPRRRSLAASGLWLAAFSYLPSSNVVPLARYIADTYVHAPVLGLALAFGAAIDASLARARVTESFARATVAMLGISFSIAVLPSELRFHDSVSLWAHTFARNPGDYRICQNLSIAYYDVAGPAEVLAATDRCIARFGPEHFEKNRGIALFRLGRRQEARVELERARARRPDDPVIAHYLRLIDAAR